MHKDKKKLQVFKREDNQLNLLIKQIMADPSCHITDKECLEKLTINVINEILKNRLEGNIFGRINDLPTSQLMELIACQNKN